MIACCLPPAACRIVPRAVLLSAHAQATIAGTWFTEDSSSKVTITQSGNAYTGKVTWVKTDGAVDAKNSDPSLRTRPILGIDILTGCTGDATSAKGCRIYAPKRGSSYDARAQPRQGWNAQGEGEGRHRREDPDLDKSVILSEVSSCERSS